MRRLLVIALSTATCAFVPPKRDALVEIAGVYEAVGTHPDGSTYRGKGTITRLGGERYAIRFDMPSGTFRALCLRMRDVLACGWGPSANVTVAVWQATGSVNGIWSNEDDAGVGREELTGTTLDTPTTGSGVTPSGDHYNASMSTTPYGALHRVTWVRGSKNVQGWGIRVGNLLVAGFPYYSVGAAFYRIGLNGTSLVGDWMDPAAASSGLGTETLTR